VPPTFGVRVVVACCVADGAAVVVLPLDVDLLSPQAANINAATASIANVFRAFMLAPLGRTIADI